MAQPSQPSSPTGAATTADSFASVELQPCPFCGFQPALSDEDVLYPIGRKRDLWNLNCPVSSGGCDASILGAGPQECIEAWNRRVGQATACAGKPKRKPTGYVATCQCGVAVGALDRQRTPVHEASQILGRWLSEGYTITPQFGPSWTVSLASCCCESPASAHDSGAVR